MTFLIVHLIGHQAVGQHRGKGNHTRGFWMSKGSGLEELMNKRNNKGSYVRKNLDDLFKPIYEDKYENELLDQLNTEVCLDIF